ncbi:ParE family toxin-like protein [Rhizobium sp. L74/93]
MQKVADQNFELLKTSPMHPSLHFKKVGNLWSARVGLSWRALAAQDGQTIIWFWIGSHTDYDKLLR